MANSITPEQEAQVEDFRSKEQWVRYDTIMVGFTARQTTQNGWQETFAQFADQDLLVWNDGSRTKQVGKSWCNQSGSTEDYSQLIYETGVEYFGPIGYGRDAIYAADAMVMPAYWINNLPRAMSFSVKMQDTDEWLLVPGSHLPGGTGISGNFADDSGMPQIWGGQTGIPGLGQVWKWPKPLEVAKKTKLVVEGTIDKPVKPFLQQLDALPFQASFTVPDGKNPGQFKQATLNLWYGIRVWHRGPRNVQLRGAYTG